MLYFIAFLHVVAWCAVIAVGSTAPSWGACPSSQTVQSSYIRDCANITFPLNRDDASLGNVNSFVRRFYAGDSPTNVSLWLIEGGPGFSTRPFNPIADYFVSQNTSWTVYTVDARGTGLSSLLTCETNGLNPGFYFNPFNATDVNQHATCNQRIIDEYGNVSIYYTVYNSALDFKGVIDAVNPEIVMIYAVSYGTYFTNTYLQLPDARFDVVVLDGPVPPNRWPMENNAMWNSLVSQDVLRLCVANSSVCSSYLGAMGHLPQLVKDAVIDGTLPCLKNISWLNARDGHFITTQFTNYMTATRSAHTLLGPFWYRLYRCSASDIEQINNFYNVRMDMMTPDVADVLDYSYGLGINLGVNELYSFEGNDSLTYDEQVLITDRLFSSGNGELSVSYAKYVSKIPSYTPYPECYLRFAKVDVPVLVTVGTLDPNTEHGLGPWYTNGLGNTTTFVSVPYATHGILAYDAPCANSIIVSFLNSLGAAPLDTSCLADLQAPDFDGSEEDTQQLSLQMFGTTDLWNAGQEQRDTSTTTCSCPDDECDWSTSDVDSLIIGLVVPFSVVILGQAICIVWLLRSASGKESPLASHQTKSPDAL